MNTTTVTQTISFKTAYGEIKEGASLFLDIGPGKIGKDKKEYLGFPPIKVKRFGGTKFSKTPILVVRIANQEHFKPEIAGERWKVVVQKIEVTPQLTLNKAFQRVLLHIEAVERVENSFEYYDEKTRQYVIGTRSGKVIICRDVFGTEEETTEYRDQQMVMEVLNVYARVTGSARQLVFQKLIGGVAKSILIEERASEKASDIAQAMLRNKEHGTRDGIKKRAQKEAAKEIEEHLANLLPMPEKLKELK